MKITRRDFAKSTVAMLPLGFTACGTQSNSVQDKNNAQDKNLVVFYLAGGNDALSFLVPHADPEYYKRRPSQALASDQVHKLGKDNSGAQLGLHPSLAGLKKIYDDGNASIIQRVGYKNASRSHFLGADITATADEVNHKGNGWLGRFMDTLPGPVDPLFAWNTQFQLPRAFFSDSVQVSSISDPNAFVYYNHWNEMGFAQQLAALKQTSSNTQHLSSTALNALSSLDRVRAVLPYEPAVKYPNSKLGDSLKLVASAIANNVGTKIFWVQMSGFDTHSRQGTKNGRYNKLMLELDHALLAFYDDLKTQDALNKTLVMQYSEFGRRIDENGSAGTDHGAAGLMTLIGGEVNGGLYGAAASLKKDLGNPDLENNAFDVRPNIDFRAVYTEVLENWLGADAQSILGAQYKSQYLNSLFS